MSFSGRPFHPTVRPLFMAAARKRSGVTAGQGIDQLQPPRP